jgi:hypothetical protein
VNKKVKTLAAIFTLAGGICLGAGAISHYKSGDTNNGIVYGVAAILSTTAGAIGLKNRHS